MDDLTKADNLGREIVEAVREPVYRILDGYKGAKNAVVIDGIIRAAATLVAGAVYAVNGGTSGVDLAAQQFRDELNRSLTVRAPLLNRLTQHHDGYQPATEPGSAEQIGMM